MPDRGEVWVADLNPRRGTEPGQTRPVLIVQAQALLDAGRPLPHHDPRPSPLRHPTGAYTPGTLKSWVVTEAGEKCGLDVHRC